MKPADFHIGLEFISGPLWWRCTEVGTRTVTAIRLVMPSDFKGMTPIVNSPLSGKPDGVATQVLTALIHELETKSSQLGCRQLR